MAVRRSFVLAAVAAASVLASPHGAAAGGAPAPVHRAPGRAFVDAGPGSPVAAPRVATTLWSHGDPTGDEQLLLELMNRARRDPDAEADLLFANYYDQQIAGAVDYFLNQRPSVEYTRIENRSAFRSYPAKPPFAFDARLIASARKHSQLSVAKDGQSHQFPGESALRTRVEDEGYSGGFVGESVFSYANSILYAHAGFSIDWAQATGTDGRPVLGHRLSLMDWDGSRPFVQAGVGVVADSDAGTDVGPLVVTIDFAEPTDGSQFVTGICWADADGDGFYDPGEGIPGVTITSPASTYHTVSSASGGYALPVPANAGAIQVTADGGSASPGSSIGMQTADVTMGADNLKLDFAAAPEPPRPAAQSFSTSVSTPLADGGTADVPLVVPAFDADSATIGDADVTVALTHPDMSQVRIRVRSPSGTEIVLSDHGLPLADLAGTFDDTLAPVGDLRLLAGEPYAGTWHLIVDDDATPGAGSVESFGVRVRPGWVRPLAARRTNLSLTSLQAKDSKKPGADSLRLAATIDVGGAAFDAKAPVLLRLLRSDGSEIQRFDVAALGAVPKVRTGVAGTSRSTVSFVLKKLDLVGPLPSPLTVELAAGGVVARTNVPLRRSAYVAAKAPPAAPFLRVDRVVSKLAKDGLRTTTVQGRIAGGAVTGLVEVFLGETRLAIPASSFTQTGTRLRATPTGGLRKLQLDTRTGAFTLQISPAQDPLVDGTIAFAIRLGPDFYADTVVVPAVAGTTRSY